MALVLGLSAGPHDSGACLFRGGALLRAANEERFTRRKQDGRFPKAAIAYCLESEGLHPDDLAAVAVGWHFGAEAAEARIHKGLAELGVVPGRVRMFDHHSCHAAAALYLSPFQLPGTASGGPGAAGQSAVCLTLDGRGDFSAGKLAELRVPDSREQAAAAAWTEFRVLDSMTMFDSVGFLWAFVTAVLGFKPFRHEGKLTGLAGHGDASQTLQIFEEALRLEQGPGSSWRLRTPWHGEALDNFQLYLSGLEDGNPSLSNLESFKLCRELRRHKPADVAAGLQLATERLVLGYLERNGSARPNVCLAGGVFANVRLNMRIRADLDKVQRVFVYPNMGDGGLCVGAAALASRELGLLISAPKGNCFLGPEFRPDELREALELHLHDAELVEEWDEGAFARHVAAHVHAGNVVGFFYGAMEFGPRALGHRSLLARATDPGLCEALNTRLRRTEFMPFAPVTLRAHAAEAYLGWDAEDLEAGRHMTTCYEVSSAMRALCPAVVHVDGTARPQVVDERDGLYFQVVEAYAAASGVHSLVNTSFNVHEQPIICTPRDAVAALGSGACDMLAMYPYFLAPRLPAHAQ
uniref:Nodulation protein NolO n=1 Tax=Alexandrium pacificum TaxID=1565494 RepID=A0AA49X993_9DINO|nr:nodulation protein NolO [Alexandrium pacificum]